MRRYNNEPGKVNRKPIPAMNEVAPDLSPDYDYTFQPREEYDFIEGDVVICRFGRIYPIAAQKYFAKETCRMLNQSYHHDGRWKVVWTEPVENKYDAFAKIFRTAVPNRMIFSWHLTKWGDPRDRHVLDYIIDEDFLKVLEYDPKEWMLGASGAVDQWIENHFKEIYRGDDCLVKEAMESPIPGSKQLAQIT